MVLHILIIVMLFLLFSVSAFNLFSAPYLESSAHEPDENLKVSVLIPARNEENNITKCLDRVFSLEYSNIEVIVYDDESTDSTVRILEEYKKRRGDLKVIKGPSKPAGWTGKSWACHNLYKASTGDLLLFLDADVLVATSCLNRSVGHMLEKGVSLLSCFPKQVMHTLGEWFVVPLMNWILLSLLPLKLVYGSKEPSLSAANGQFMLFKRGVYGEIGGHEAVKNRPVEDVAMANLLKKKGKKIATFVTKTEITCRMYRGFRESIEGFTKNFFPGFNMRGTVFTVFISVLFAAFFMPFIFVFSDGSYIFDIMLILFIRASVSFLSGQNILINVLFHPFQMVVMLFVGFGSLHASLTGNVRWKGRRI